MKYDIEFRLKDNKFKVRVVPFNNRLQMFETTDLSVEAVKDLSGVSGPFSCLRHGVAHRSSGQGIQNSTQVGGRGR